MSEEVARAAAEDAPVLAGHVGPYQCWHSFQRLYFNSVAFQIVQHKILGRRITPHNAFSVKVVKLLHFIQEC